MMLTVISFRENPRRVCNEVAMIQSNPFYTARSDEEAGLLFYLTNSRISLSEKAL